MASNPLLTVRINNAKSERSNLGAVKQKLSDNLADIVMLRRAFSKWESAFNANGGNNAAAYQEALGTLPTDNPDTEYDEGISEAEFIKKAEQYFEKSWSDINPDDLESIQNEIQTIQGKVKEYLGKSFSVDMQISDIDAEIDDLTSIQKSQGMIEDSGSE